jgi:hypothetical protein
MPAISETFSAMEKPPIRPLTVIWAHACLSCVPLLSPPLARHCTSSGMRCCSRWMICL